MQDLKFMSGNKCFLPITLKDGEQQVMAQIDAKNIVFVPQQLTVDGQQGKYLRIHEPIVELLFNTRNSCILQWCN